jgi:hypothetical protein
MIKIRNIRNTINLLINKLMKLYTQNIFYKIGLTR